jgi:hypothetical protein
MQRRIISQQQQQREARMQAERQRLSQQQQQQMIAQQQIRVTQYQQQLEQQQLDAARNADGLQRQRRSQQYQYMVQYNERLRQQQWQLQRSQFDYNNDPYFYSAPIYRYYRYGRYYDVNQYGADLLRQAVNYGYEQGYMAGRADRRDHWRFDYRDSFAYQDANYGYSGYYLDRDEYSYYFRQGFRRGYSDGYYRHHRYGTYNDGSYNILGSMLSVILRLQTDDGYRY